MQPQTLSRAQRPRPPSERAPYALVRGAARASQPVEEPSFELDRCSTILPLPPRNHAALHAVDPIWMWCEPPEVGDDPDLFEPVPETVRTPPDEYTAPTVRP